MGSGARVRSGRVDPDPGCTRCCIQSDAVVFQEQIVVDGGAGNCDALNCRKCTVPEKIDIFGVDVSVVGGENADLPEIGVPPGNF